MPPHAARTVCTVYGARAPVGRRGIGAPARTIAAATIALTAPELFPTPTTTYVPTSFDATPAAPALPFAVGERVRCRDDGQKWMAGTATRVIGGVMVQPHGWPFSCRWDQAERIAGDHGGGVRGDVTQMEGGGPTMRRRAGDPQLWYCDEVEHLPDTEDGCATAPPSAGDF
eukprot:gene18169-12282_t